MLALWAAAFTHYATVPAPRVFNSFSVRVTFSLLEQLICCFVLFCFVLKIYLFERQLQRGRGRERGRGLSSICWFTLQIAAMARAGLIRSQEAGASSRASTPGAGPKYFRPSSTDFPGHGRELDRKWRSWDSNQCPYGMLAPQAMALPTTPQRFNFSFPQLTGRGSIPEFFHIMKRKFTNKEWETIRSFKDEWTQLDMFYRNWALKESYIKAIGVGLGFELQRLEFEISPLNLDIGQVYKETRLFLDGEEEKEWAFEVPSLDDSKPSQRQFTILTFNDLISSAVPMTPEDPSFWDCFCFTEEIPIRNVNRT
uniref:L-aminoadipate-semialdehyde dehydrogenase-phosphopantetheinyl transferase n=1 Tax=Oryctolagus cuniculus TaxID=9986 RepID=A0A5F9DIC8_RABIT